MLETLTRLEARVRRVRRRLKAQNALWGLLTSAFGLGVVAAPALALPWLLGDDMLGALRGFVAVASAGVLLLTLGQTFVVRRRIGRDLFNTAQYIEYQLPELRDGLTTALEFADRARAASNNESDAEASFSLDLYNRVLVRADERLAAVPPSALVPTDRLRGPLWALIVLVLGGLTAHLLYGDLLAANARLLWAGGAPKQAVATLQPRVKPVLVEGLTVIYRHPEYAAHENRVEPNATGDLRALNGTRVEISTRAVIEAQDAALIFESHPGEPLSLEIDGGGAIYGAFTITRNDSYRFRLRDKDGRVLKESTHRHIDVLRDHPPEVRLLMPREDLEVDHDQDIELLFEARDDFGLSELALAYERTHGNAPPVRRGLPIADLGPDGRGSGTLELAPLGLAPGESLTLWIEASDNDTVSGPKTSRSERRTISIYSPSQTHEAILRDAQEMFERFLMLLADRLEVPLGKPPDPTTAEQILEVTTTTVNHTRRELAKLEGLLGRMEKCPLTPEEMLRDFAEMHSQMLTLLEQETGELSGILGRDPPARYDSSHLKALGRHNARAIETTEHAVLTFDRALDRRRQERALDRGRSLIEQSDQLLALLDTLQQQDSEAGLEEMAREIERMQRSLQEVAHDILKRSKNLPLDRINVPAVTRQTAMLSLESMREELDTIRGLVALGRLSEARERIEALATTSREMVATLENESTGRDSRRMARTSRQLRRARRHLDAVAKRQETIHEETAKREQSYSRRVRERLSERIERLPRREAGRLARIEQRLRQVERRVLHETDRTQLEHALGKVDDIRRSLEEGDLGLAVKLAERLERGVEALKDEVRQSALLCPRGDPDRQLRRSAMALERAHPLTEDLKRDLSALLPEPGEIMSRRERNQTSRLGHRQRALRQRLERLRRGMTPLGEDHPGLHGQLDRSMEAAERSMSEAEEELGRLNPGMAEEHQRSALEKLAEAGRRLDRTVRPDEERAGVGRDQDERRRVAIPRAADYQVPAEFREQVLEAMKEDAPASLRKQLEAYYEAIVR